MTCPCADAVGLCVCAACLVTPAAHCASWRAPACTRAVHDQIKRDAGAWASLPYLGLQADGPRHVLELRNCACGSTLAKRRRSTGEATP